MTTTSRNLKTFLQHGTCFYKTAKLKKNSSITKNVSFLITPNDNVPSSRPPLLFTPGPLTTSINVKQAMQIDMGSRDEAFVDIVKSVRKKVLSYSAESLNKDFECILIQGSGTFGVESVFSSVIPSDETVLIVSNGAYGRRMVEICKAHRILYHHISMQENEIPTASLVEEAMAQNLNIKYIALVHHETTTGAVSPIKEIGNQIKKCRSDAVYIVDSMSGFGALPVDVIEDKIDFLISSPNKCFESVPGFAYVIANRKQLQKTEGINRTVCLDLYSQWQGLEKNGQFRFTPPTHSILAFKEALKEIEAEGGPLKRLLRYQNNHDILKAQMVEWGFKLYLSNEIQGPIISTFLEPENSKFDINILYNELASHGFLIYPGKLTTVNTFRIGTIGRIFESDIKSLLVGFKDACSKMGITLPLKV
jgi:2-aminoethylphosphonate-pyruvate transaminase